MKRIALVAAIFALSACSNAARDKAMADSIAAAAAADSAAMAAAAADSVRKADSTKAANAKKAPTKAPASKTKM